MNNITFSFLKKKTSKTRNYYFSILVLVLMSTQLSWGQQTIGTGQYDGGFEGASISSTINSSSATPEVSKWTYDSANLAGTTISTTGARTGSKCININSVSSSGKYLSSPKLNPALVANQNYVVQCYIQSAASTSGLKGAIWVSSRLGGTAFTTTTSYTKVVSLYTGTATAATANTWAGLGTSSTFTSINVDDFVVYPGSAVDATIPTAATSASATVASTTSLTINWTGDQYAGDGGGYVIVRSTSASAVTLNANGIYAVGNTSATGSGTIIAITSGIVGSSQSFTDTSLTTGTTYYYSIFAVDKAFNYAAAATCNATPAAVGSTPPTLSVDTTANSVDNNLDITSGGDATWGAAITAVKIGVTTLAAGDWDKTTTPGTLILKPSNGNTILRSPGTKSVTIIATGYLDATVNQIITAGVPTANSTATISASLVLNTTRTITCTAKDQYNNLVSGYTFKYDATITNNSNTTVESYNLDSTAQTVTVNDLPLVAQTDSNGVATFTVALPATVDGNDGISIQIQLNNGSTNVGSAFSFTQLASQTITFGTLTPVTYGDATFNLAGTSDSGLTVTYASSNAAVATVLGNVVTITGAGTTNITASQGGNSSYNAAADVVQVLTVNQKTLNIPDAVAVSRAYNTLVTTNITGTLAGVVSADAGLVTFDGILKGTFADVNVAIGIAVTSNCTLAGTKAGNYSLTQPTGLIADITKANQAITFVATSNKYSGFTNYNPGATSATSATNPITYTSSNQTVAIIVLNQIQYVGVGVTTITASQDGNSNYNAATDALQTLTVSTPPLAAWNFFGIPSSGSGSSPATVAAYQFNSNLISSNNITRGTLATASGGSNSFKTKGFPTTGAAGISISTSNNAYYQITIQASVGKAISLSNIDANFYSSGSFNDLIIGASHQFAYSLNGGSTLVAIGNVLTTTATSAHIDLSNVAALQNVAGGTTITLRYYSSTVTTGGGAGGGFNSGTASSVDDGLVIGGSVVDLPTWNGTAWSNTTGPDSTLEAIIAGNYNTTTNGAFTAKKLTINSGTLTVSSGTTLTVQNEVINSGGNVVIENNANLIQVNNTTNTGNVVVNRNGSALSRLDYTLWSSPVASQNLLAFSPLTVTSRFYTYDTSAGTNGLYSAIANPATTSFTPGAGYLIRMPDNAVTAPSTQVFNGQFTGVLNNGDVPFTMTDGGSGKRYNLVGNPYPSPITMSSFVTDNANITGTLYFWRKTNGVGTAYCTWAGGTFVTNSNAQSANPNGVIQTGQGFFVEGNGNGTSVLFKNTQRVANTAGQFFRTTDDVENNRIWLNATNSAGDFSQMAVGYMTGATQGIDAFDGKYINDSAVALTSNINNEEYIIQGRALPFVSSDVVPLNFKTTTAGDYNIAIDHVDGLFATGQDVFLVDNVTGSATNLRTNGYTFTAVAGVNNSRFILTFQGALNTNGLSFNDNNVKVYKNNGILNVNSGAISMKNVKIFDIQGRLIAEQKNVNATSTTFKDLRVNQQVLIVQVTSEDNIVVNKKVVN